MITHAVEVDAVDIHVEDAGEGRPVMLIHGFTGSAATMADIGSRLGPRRQLRVDLVGHGLSSAPADVGSYTMGATVSQLATVIEQLADESIDLVGYSLGGRVALSLMVARPELVRSASLIGATPGLTSAAQREHRMLADETLARGIGDRGLEDFVDRWMALPMGETLKDSLTPQQWLESRAQRLCSNPLGLANSLRGVGTGAMPALHDALADIVAPTQFIAGALDTKFAAIAAAMAESIPNSIVTLIDGAGHAAHVEKPGTTGAAIVSFLR